MGCLHPLGQEILIMEKRPSLRSRPRPAREPYTGGNWDQMRLWPMECSPGTWKHLLSGRESRAHCRLLSLPTPLAASSPGGWRWIGAPRSPWCCLGVSAAGLDEYDCWKRLPGFLLPGDTVTGGQTSCPARPTSKRGSAGSPGRRLRNSTPSPQAGPAHSELSSNVTSSGRPSLTTL